MWSQNPDNYELKFSLQCPPSEKTLGMQKIVVNNHSVYAYTMFKPLVKHRRKIVIIESVNAEYFEVYSRSKKKETPLFISI